MDFSNYDEGHPLYSSERKKKPGYFKDEYPSAKIKECVAVRSKCYFLRIRKGKNHVVCKGVNKNVSRTFSLRDYRKCIESESAQIKVSMPRLRAKKRNMALVNVHKLSLSSGDDKRYLTCNVHSVPYGSILRQNNKCIKCVE